MSSVEQIKAIVENEVRSEEYKKRVSSLLLNLCKIDTTPNANPAVMKKNEDEIFCEIRKELEGVKGQGKFVPISPEIEKHPAFSLLHFTKTADNPQGLPVDKVYDKRHNFLFSLTPDVGSAPAEGRNLAINAHVDVISPFVAPKLEKSKVLGRGACDDKGACVAMIEATRIFDRLRKENHVKLNKKITLMFVVEEETGGNGSLSLAIDKELKKNYDSMLVLECVGNRLYPANRGAVWYKTEVEVPSRHQLAATSWIILALEVEGRKIKGESSHPLFPKRPVQTCHGIIGPFGEHPSRICGRVCIEIETRAELIDIERVVSNAVAEYTAVYGDKTKFMDPVTGKPKVEKHFDLKKLSTGRFSLEIYGSSGHMGAILENDGAITKMAYIVRRLVSEIPGVSMALSGQPENSSKIVLEGGQGFLPTHKIEDVMHRLSVAAAIGLAEYAEVFGAPGAKCHTTFDKLHNSAFDGDPRSPSMCNALKAMEICSMPAATAQVEGLSVSCDARLFACEYPELPVITTGPGSLNHAHSDFEQLDIDELMDTIRFLVLYMLLETGSVK